MNNRFETKLNESEQKMPTVIKLLKENYPNTKFKLIDKLGDRADRELSCDLITENDFTQKQESWAIKVREPKYESFNDVTVEYKNAVGTQYEKNGDWWRFRGGVVNIYVYGWSNGKTRLLVIDIKKMMTIPLDKWTNPIQNYVWGRSNFKAIKVSVLFEYNVILKEIIYKSPINNGD